MQLLASVTDDLVKQAVKLFVEPFDKLLNSVDVKCKVAIGADVDALSYTVPADLKAQIEAAMDEWKIGGKVRRLWARDASLWTGSDEGSWLGWLGITEDQLANADHLEATNLYATKLLGAETADWRCTGCDPGGLDLQAGAITLRLDFPERVTGPGELRKMLVKLAGEARAKE